jgi:hypothetical protein
VNGHLPHSRPKSLPQNLAFGKYPPIRRGGLYLSYAVLLDGKVSPQFVAHVVRYVGCRGVAMAPLVRPKRRQVRPMDYGTYGTVTVCRRSLLLDSSRGKLPFVTTDPRPWELLYPPCQVRLPNCEPPL